MLIPKKTAPRGFPRRRSVSETPVPSEREVFSRKSCVMAIPMEAKANEVRSQARKVLSS